MSFLERLDALDRGAFLAINGMHAPWADGLMEVVSSMVLWFPLYLFFLYLLQRRFGWKALGWSVLLLAVMILFSDKGSVMLFKEPVQRLRPRGAVARPQGEGSWRRRWVQRPRR